MFGLRERLDRPDRLLDTDSASHTCRMGGTRTKSYTQPTLSIKSKELWRTIHERPRYEGQACTWEMKVLAGPLAVLDHSGISTAHTLQGKKGRYKEGRCKTVVPLLTCLSEHLEPQSCCYQWHLSVITPSTAPLQDSNLNELPANDEMIMMIKLWTGTSCLKSSVVARKVIHRE
jgi:hypothetical protein